MSRVVALKFWNKFFDNGANKKSHLDAYGQFLETKVLGNAQGENCFDRRFCSKVFSFVPDSGILYTLICSTRKWGGA